MLSYALPSAPYLTFVFCYVIDSKRLKQTTQQQNAQYCRSKRFAYRWHHPNLRVTGKLVTNWLDRESAGPLFAQSGRTLATVQPFILTIQSETQ